MDQSESSEHIKVTADIRRAIMEDESMSVSAQNVTIITDETGAVTLRGNVPTEAEKRAIEAKAKAVAGAARVTNSLVVKPD
jgi:osmotically-inducible protein OsmY